jgi:hypothetical protein
MYWYQMKLKKPGSWFGSAVAHKHCAGGKWYLILTQLQ